MQESLATDCLCTESCFVDFLHTEPEFPSSAMNVLWTVSEQCTQADAGYDTRGRLQHDLQRSRDEKADA